MTPAEIHAALKTVKKEDILGIECKHAAYNRSREDPSDDMLTVKELIHLKDGRKIPRLRSIENYKRPFWITKEGFRNHEDKKEWEYLNKLKRFETTQSKLNASIVRALGYGRADTQLRVLARSQYLYGCDITTPALIKAGYQTRWPGLFTPNTVAVMDTETDVVNGDGTEPILVTVTFKDKAFVAIYADWMKGIADPIGQVRKALEEHLGDVIKARNISFEIELFDDRGEMCYEAIQRLHQWQPDFVAFWNMDFDIQVLMQALDRSGYNLADTFSDPRVAPKYRHFRYKPGPKTKLAADGSVENLASYDRWNVVEAPCSFVFIDAMCVYRQIRRAKGKEASYGLGDTLERHLNRGKLYFKTGDSTAKGGTIEWHTQMQRNFKIPYTVYNVFDCLGIELLDEKTRDLQTQISILSGYSDYSVFHSNPRRAADQLHFFCLNLGKAVGSVSDKMIDDNDKHLLGKEEWIVTLPTHLVAANGLYLIEELPNVRSLVRMYVSDADITSTYPNGEIIMNLSKETTMLEMARIKGIPASRQRLIGINLTGGPANAIEILGEVMHAPPPGDLLAAFKEDLKARRVA